MEKTAVDYLIREVSAILGQLKTEPMQDLLLVDAINKANKMFEQQIIDAHRIGECEVGLMIVNKPEQYYNETYGSKGSETTSSQTEISDEEIEIEGLLNR